MRFRTFRTAKDLRDFAKANRAQVTTIRRSMRGKRNNAKQLAIQELDQELRAIVKAYVKRHVITSR